MSRPIAILATRRAEFDAAHEALDRTRSTSTTVRVDRVALAHLLMDHAKMLRDLETLGPVRYRGNEEIDQ